MEEFRKMRRFKQQLSYKDAETVLRRCTNGILAVYGDNDYPYAVPISYIYSEGKIYMHSALAGHKLDGIRRNPKVSFCVVDKDQIVPEEFTTYFRSVIAFGKARIITDLEEMRIPHNLLCEKYCPNQTQDELEAEFKKGATHMLYIEITIEHMSGKQARELIPPMHK